MERIWSHATEQKWYESPYTGIFNKRFYVASGVWGICPSGGANTKWDNARIAVIAHECAHFLGLPDLYNKDGNGGAGSFELLGKFSFPKAILASHFATNTDASSNLLEYISKHVGMEWRPGKEMFLLLITGLG